MKNEAFNWTTDDGLSIYAKDWKVAAPTAVIGLVHGMGEHINRYNHLAAFFNKKNFAVVGFDQRGHGQSEGQRGHAPNLQILLDSISELLVEIEIRYPDLPVFLYGHSMGGGIVLNYVLRRHPTIQGAVVTSPWIDLAFSPSSGRVMLGKLMRILYPKYSESSNLETQYLAHDLQVVKDYVADPLVHDQITAAMAMGMIDGGKWLLNYHNTVKIPLLIMHAGDDQITSPRASEQLAKQLNGDVTFKKWAGLYHEIHNEAQQEEIFRFTYNWMSDRVTD